MRKCLVLLSLVLFITSCDWRPDEIEVIQITTSRTMNLAIDDTITLNIFGTDFSEIKGQNSAVAEVIEALQVDAGNMITIIGTGVGRISLSFTYNAPRESTISPASASYIIQLNVSESIPIFINVGELLPLDISPYLSNEQVAALDSVAILVSQNNPGGRVEVEEEVESLTDFTITGVAPGLTDVEILCYNASGDQITALKFHVEIKIQKQVLAELFTNTGCVNCPEANHYLDNLSQAFPADMAVVRYHVSWTDPADPMNLYNPEESMERVLYYTAYAAPTLVLDGEKVGTLDENDWSTRIITAAEAEAELYVSQIDVIESVDSLLLEYELSSFGVEYSDLAVWTLVLEDSIEYLGSNGEDLHMDVMRDMTSSRIISLTNSLTIQHSLKKPDDYGFTGPMNLLVFVQSESDKAVLQARKQILY
ncbi:MAG: hypothetical protein HOL36_06300 [Candidatus Marinimicrobia bacterium]|jgi:thiol-disulfide isomerase/thioredoxin|nr:hypothetical protein [Candidatus Neomarinimicrobiota bacterium]